MNILLLGTLSGTLLGWLMGFLSIFLILLILIQRGKGGGLTGALGGAGGQSAFGSKAGDTFTVITIIVASIWAFTCAFTMWLLGTQSAPPMAEQPAITSGPEDEGENGDAASDLLIPTEGGGLSGPQQDEGGDELTPADQLTPADPATGAGEGEPQQPATP